MYISPSQRLNCRLLWTIRGVAAAQRAGRRGGRLSAARLLARAAELTGTEPARNGRLIAAAEAAADAGAAPLALQYLDRIRFDQLDSVLQGRVIAVRASLALFLTDPSMVVRSAAEMLTAAEHFSGHEEAREQRALFAAFEMLLVSEGLTEGTTLDEVGSRLLPGAVGGDRAVLLKGLAALARS